MHELALAVVAVCTHVVFADGRRVAPVDDAALALLELARTLQERLPQRRPRDRAKAKR